MIIKLHELASTQLDDIYSNKTIYNKFGQFTQQFTNWNYEFYRYVNIEVISNTPLKNYGWYKIGKIGVLEYKRVTTNSDEIFEVIQFRFSVLPTIKNKKSYNVIGDAGYGYKVIQSTFNGKNTILTPQKTYLTKFIFDNIIGFHHSSNDYNTIYAVGFINNRAYAIYQNGNIQSLPYTKEQYVNQKHKYYEVKQYHNKIVLTENQLRNIIKKTIQEFLI